MMVERASYVGPSCLCSIADSYHCLIHIFLEECRYDLEEIRCDLEESRCDLGLLPVLSRPWPATSLFSSVLEAKR